MFFDDWFPRPLRLVLRTNFLQMKKIYFLILIVIAATTGHTQIRKPDSNPINKPAVNTPALPAKETNISGNSAKTTTAATGSTQQKPTGTSESSAQPVDNAPYIISGARVTITTGSDDKEYPSKVKIYLFPPAVTTYTYTYTLGQQNITNAMVVSSTSQEIGLTPLYQQKIPWPVYYAPGYNGSSKTSNPFTSGSHNWMLDDVLRQGFRLLIAYHPNLALDAWQIKQVTVKLKVEKADGSPHPTLNNKTIVFNVSTPLLGVPTGLALVCEADKNLEPTTNYLTKDILVD